VTRVASAKRHAQAVFKIALENNDVEKWRSELEAIATTLSDSQIRVILENPKVHFNEKLQLVNKLLPELSQLALNFVYFLVAKQRLGILNQIVSEYEQMANAYQGLEHAKVITAIPMDEEEQRKLSETLSAITNRQIVLTTEVDPSILGGFIARIGDTLIDGSTKAKLEALKKRLSAQTHSMQT
jgi:F-type H+-transporting ATPase subunit delta